MTTDLKCLVSCNKASSASSTTLMVTGVREAVELSPSGSVSEDLLHDTDVV